VPQELRVGGIRALADALLVRDGGKLIRGRQRHLDIARSVSLEEIDFVLGEPLRLAYFADDDSGRPDTSGDSDTARRALPCALELDVRIEAIDRFVEVAHEARPAELAIREDREPRCLLLLQRIKDVAVLDRGELRVGDARIFPGVE